MSNTDTYAGCWMDTEKELPLVTEENNWYSEKVLITDGVQVFIAYLSDFDQALGQSSPQWHSVEYSSIVFKDITHWMKLPCPPRIK